MPGGPVVDRSSPPAELALRPQGLDGDVFPGGQFGDPGAGKPDDPDPAATALYLGALRLGQGGQSLGVRRPDLNTRIRPQRRRRRDVLAGQGAGEEAAGRAEFPDPGRGRGPQRAVEEHGHDVDEGADVQQGADDRVGQLGPGAQGERRAQDTP